MKTFLALSLLVSSVALAGPPNGHYRMTANKEYPGDLFLAPVADHLCAYYRYDKDAAKPGGMTLKVDGNKVAGTWEEGLGTGKVNWKLVGKTLDGTYTDGDGPDTSPWVANFVDAPSIKLEKSYDIDWDGGSIKSTIVFKQAGTKVTGKVEGRYSGTEGGTVTGTLYGNLLAAIYEDKLDGGGVQKGIVLLRFEKTIGSRTYNYVDGLYSADLKSCSNGGLMSGSPTK